jgi:hypothetical protein
MFFIHQSKLIFQTRISKNNTRVFSQCYITLILLSAIRNKEIIFYHLNPLPNLPPRGKELKIKPFPLGGNGKGGHL